MTDWQFGPRRCDQESPNGATAGPVAARGRRERRSARTARRTNSGYTGRPELFVFVSHVATRFRFSSHPSSLTLMLILTPPGKLHLPHQLPQKPPGLFWKQRPLFYLTPGCIVAQPKTSSTEKLEVGGPADAEKAPKVRSSPLVFTASRTHRRGRTYGKWHTCTLFMEGRGGGGRKKAVAFDV